MKNREKEEISGRKGKNREKVLSLCLLTDRAGYATEKASGFVAPCFSLQNDQSKCVAGARVTPPPPPHLRTCTIQKDQLIVSTRDHGVDMILILLTDTPADTSKLWSVGLASSCCSNNHINHEYHV